VQENGLNYNYLKISQYPSNKIGYRSLDLQLSKNINLPHSSSAQIRLDVLNATNARNYAQIFDGWPLPMVYYNTTGDIAGVPRTVKVSLSYKL